MIEAAEFVRTDHDHVGNALAADAQDAAPRVAQSIVTASTMPASSELAIRPAAS